MNLSDFDSRAALVQWWNGLEDRERDTMIAALRWKREGDKPPYWVDLNDHIKVGVPVYTSSWAHAGPLLEEMGPGLALWYHEDPIGKRWATGRIYFDDHFTPCIESGDIVHQPTPCRAICLAYVIKRWEEGRK